MREFQSILEQYRQTWAAAMIRLLVDIKAEVDAAPADQVSLPPERLAHFEERRDDLMAQDLEANLTPTGAQLF